MINKEYLTLEAIILGKFHAREADMRESNISIRSNDQSKW